MHKPALFVMGIMSTRWPCKMTYITALAASRSSLYGGLRALFFRRNEKINKTEINKEIFDRLIEFRKELNK